jgi:hypothetical protein
MKRKVTNRLSPRKRVFPFLPESRPQSSTSYPWLIGSVTNALGFSSTGRVTLAGFGH